MCRYVRAGADRSLGGIFPRHRPPLICVGRLPLLHRVGMPTAPQPWGGFLGVGPVPRSLSTWTGYSDDQGAANPQIA
jgi:hypothetical protein